MTSSVLRLEHLSAYALDTVLDFGDEVLVGDVFYVFAGASQSHTIHWRSVKNIVTSNVKIVKLMNSFTIKYSKY